MKKCVVCGKDMSKKAWYWEGCKCCPSCTTIEVEEYDVNKHGKLEIHIIEAV